MTTDAAASAPELRIRPLTVSLRPEVAALPRYVPGRSLPGATKLSSNEAPDAPATTVLDAATAALGHVNRYPDLTAAPLRAALARRFSVDVGQVVIGTGSSAVLLAALQVVSRPGAEVVFPWRSFESYPIAVPASHATPRPVPLAEDWSLDLDALAAAVTDATVALIVCTPNNPTGPAVPLSDLTRLLDRVPDRVLVLVDEAYIEFADHSSVGSAVSLLADHPNLLVLRTFSKAYALAGLRVGYGLGHPDLIGAIQAVSVPFGVSGVAQAAALAALEDEAGLAARVESTIAERGRLIARLRELGWAVPDSQSNFVWLPGAGADLVDECLAAHVIVRPFPEGVRVSVGAPEENDRFLAVATVHAGRR